MALALALFGWIEAVGQIPDYVTDPADGQEFSEKFSITFFEPMQETIAIDFSGAGGVQFTCEWVLPLPEFPRQFLECTPNAALPANSTVTWTINPGGTGFTTEAGRVLPTSSGTFTVPDGGGGISVTPFPADGAFYDPAIDGPVTFSFSEEMDQTIDLATAASFDLGSWNREWTDGFTLECTLVSAAAPGIYSYTLSGFQSLTGTPLDDFNGSFEIQDEGGGDLTVFPSPADGATYNPLLGQPVSFTFSTPMDQTVDPQSAITFDAGSWSCSWTFPGVPSVSCTPIGGLSAGTYHYTLSGFRSDSGETYPDFSGSFVVDSGTGGEGGVRASECPEVDPVPIPFPKTLAVCGTNFFVWDFAMVFPAAGEGYVVTGSSRTGSSSFESLDSVVRLDGEGRLLSGVTAVNVGTELALSADLNVLYASYPPSSTNALMLGAYDSDTLAPVYERSFDLAGAQPPNIIRLEEGRVAVVQDRNTNINVMVLSASGTVDWSKRYASTSFGTEGSGGLPGQGGSQTVSLMPMPTGYLLAVNQTKTSLSGSNISFANTNILARLAEDGAVQWAKKYTGIDGLSSSFVRPVQNGDFILQGTKITLSGEDETSFSSVLVRLDPNGDPTWGTEFSGASISPSGELPENKLFVVGSLMDPEGDEPQSVFGIVDGSGSLERLITLQSGPASFGFAVVDDNRIRYGLQSISTGVDTNVLVGSSSLQLGDWVWRRFSKPADNPLVLADPNNTDVIFSYFDDATHALSIVRLDGNLQTDAPCALFVDVSIDPGETNVVTSDATVNVVADTVSETPFIPESFSAAIPLQSFTIVETDLCDGSGGEPTPATIIVRPNGASEVVLEFDTALGFLYGLQSTATLNPPDWQDVETVPGTGVRLGRTFSAGGLETYWRIVTTSQ